MKNLILKALYYILFINFILILEIGAQTVKLKIIETTDEHGAAFPYDFTNQRPMNSSLAQTSTYVKEERAKKDQQVILLSGGDLLQGTPLVYYYNFERTDTPHAWAEIMNYMQYDAGAVGNHDIETGHPVYDRFNKELNFPWLAANAVYENSGEPYFNPYTVIERGGVKVAVLGLVTPAIPNWLPPNIWEGMEFLDMVETANKWIRIIKEKEKPDLIVGLFHSGVEATYGGQKEDSPKNENASRLIAESVPGFDIIFVGHDHRGWNYSVKNSDGGDVLILGGTSSGRDAAVANCVLTYNSAKKIWIKDISGEVIETKNFPPDNEFITKFKYAFDEVDKYVKRPIGTITKSISSTGSLFGPSSFTDMIQMAQLELTKADVSFSAPLSLDSKINEGEITVGNMFNIYRYENLLYTMSLSGREIKDYLEYSYKLWFNQMKNDEDHLLNFRLDENGNIKLSDRNKAPILITPFYNFDCAAGINYTVDLSKPAGEKIRITTLSNGDPFDLEKIYKVAVNSYRGNGGGGHLVEGAKIPKNELAKRIISSTDKDLRYYMMKRFEQSKTVEPELLNNWKIIPAEWWNKAKEQDEKLMFPKSRSIN